MNAKERETITRAYDWAMSEEAAHLGQDMHTALLQQTANDLRAVANGDREIELMIARLEQSARRHTTGDRQ